MIAALVSMPLVANVAANDVELVGWLRAAMASGEARRIREGHRLRQAEASRAIDAAPNLVSRWESGARSPRGEFAIRYAKLLRRLREAS